MNRTAQKRALPVEPNPKLKPKPLENLGNTCFLNSVLQCITATYQLDLYRRKVTKPIEFSIPRCSVVSFEKQFDLKAFDFTVVFDQPTPFIKTFWDFLDEFYNGRKLKPDDILARLREKHIRFKGRQQQDAHEAFLHLIDDLKQEELDAVARTVKKLLCQKCTDEKFKLHIQVRSNFAVPLIDSCFGGCLVQKISCRACAHHSFTFERFSNLSLAMSTGDDEKTIGRMLDNFTSLDLMTGENAYTCENCCKFVIAEKKYSIYSPPPTLVLHLKRFEKGLDGKPPKKIYDYIKFPLILDVTPYCSDKNRDIASGQEKILYSLYGVVSYSGGLGGGHYVAYVKHRGSMKHTSNFFKKAMFFDASAMGSFEKYDKLGGLADAISKLDLEAMDEKKARKIVDENSAEAQWYYCTDLTIETVGEKRVLGVEAYMLFYERIY